MGFSFPFFSFSAISKRIRRTTHHHSEAHHIRTVSDTTGRSFHCWVVSFGGILSLLQILNEGLALHKDFYILADGGAKILAC